LEGREPLIVAVWSRRALGKARGVAVQVRRRFEPSNAGIRQAREFLREALAGRAGGGISEDMSLAVSELATNAVTHAGTAFDVVVETDGSLRVEVEDGSTATPIKQPTSATALHGRGLQIVEELCDRWGVHVVRDRKCVWCERALG
jgi:anti-sigma regulatory factor (Ser/Thr protein kinase)